MTQRREGDAGERDGDQHERHGRHRQRHPEQPAQCLGPGSRGPRDRRHRSTPDQNGFSMRP